MWLVVLILLILGVYLLHKFFKIPKLSNLVLVTGGVKTGKSTMSVYFALKAYKRSLFRWKVARFLSIFFKRFRGQEKPLLYSNVPLRCDYVPLTKELILRKERFAYRSVVYIQEASLFADSMAWKDDDVNDCLRLLNKLIAHETKGGQLFYDTQAVSDLHLGIKRCLQSYFYIHHSIKVPFFVICYVREMLYSAEEAGINNLLRDDVEYSGLRRVIIPKSVWKKFDCYTYSGLTDHLPVEKNIIKGRKRPDLKSYDYLSVKDIVKKNKKPVSYLHENIVKKV